MGDTTNFKVNADGSVTTITSSRKEWDTNEANILDIFRIEQIKGGVFVSRRMKRRALKYAKYANVPEHVVEKLMLDNYPNDFANYPRTTWLITWACAFLLFISSAILFTGLTYLSYDDYSATNEKYENFKDRIIPTLNVAFMSQEEYFEKMSQEQYESELEELERHRSDDLSVLLWYLSGAIGCIGVAGLCLRQYCSVRKNVIEQTTKTQNCLT